MITNLTFAEDITSTDVRVVVDGDTLNTIDAEQGINLPVLIYNNRTMIPLRNTFEMFGISGDQITWDPIERAVEVVTNNSDYIWMQIDNPEIYFNGKALKTDVPAKIFNNRTYVPIAMVSSLLGTVPEWDAETRTVIMNPSTYNLSNYRISFEYDRTNGYVLTEDALDNKAYRFEKKDVLENSIESVLVFTLDSDDINTVFTKYLEDHFLSSEDFKYLSNEREAYSRNVDGLTKTFVSVGNRTLVIESNGIDNSELKVIVESVKEVE